MNKWKIVTFVLLLVGVVIIGFEIKGKFVAKDDVSLYVSMVNKWNEELVALQVRYQKEVLQEADTDKAKKALRSIMDKHESLLRKVETFETDVDALQLTIQHYKEGIHRTIYGYQYFYYAMETNEKTLVKEGEKALKEAETFFRLHEKMLADVAHTHFIQLYG